MKALLDTLLHLMRMVGYTVVQVQSSVLVIGWQVVAPNGLFTAVPLKAGNGPTSSCALFCIKVVDDHSFEYRHIPLTRRRIHRSSSYGNLASLRPLQGPCQRVTDPADLRSSAFISGLACVACQYDRPGRRRRRNPQRSAPPGRRAWYST